MPFVNAIRKYGEHSFEWRVLGRFDSFVDALAAEVWWIARLTPAYNVTKGGQGVTGITRSQEWKDYMSKLMTARGISDATREKMRAAEPARIAKTLKPVTCVNDGNTFKSVKAAAEFYGLLPSRVTASALGRENANGLMFIKGVVLLSPEDSARSLREREERIYQKRVGSHAARAPETYLTRRGARAIPPEKPEPASAPAPTYVEGAEEKWLPIPGYGGAYEASDHGRARSIDRHVSCWANGGTMLRRGKMMAGHPVGEGRLMVTLYRDGKRVDVQISQLVAQTFLGAPDDGQVVIRRNTDLIDDRASNLYWGSRKDVATKRVRNGTGRKSQLSDAQIEFVREMRGTLTQLDLANRLGVSRCTISNIQLGKSCKTRCM